MTGDAFTAVCWLSRQVVPIPDKGLYAAKTEDGVKLGELDRGVRV